VPDHTHTIDEVPDHDHDFNYTIEAHDHDVDLSDKYLQLTGRESTLGDFIVGYAGSDVGNVKIEGGPDVIQTDFIVDGSAGNDHTHAWPQDTADGVGNIEVDFVESDFNFVWPSDSALNNNITLRANIFENLSGGVTTSDDGGQEIIDTTTGTINSVDESKTSGTVNNQSTTPSTAQGSSHNHGVNYGIFEPGSEPDIDVEVKVDGNTVTTISNVSVGDEQNTPIDLKNELDDPVTGRYHDVELVPIDTGGGNNGRCRLSADIVQKIFIESKL